MNRRYNQPWGHNNEPNRSSNQVKNRQITLNYDKFCLHLWKLARTLTRCIMGRASSPTCCRASSCEEHSSFILSYNLIGQGENQSHYVKEIVFWLGVFRRNQVTAGNTSAFAGYTRQSSTRQTAWLQRTPPWCSSTWPDQTRVSPRSPQRAVRWETLGTRLHFKVIPQNCIAHPYCARFFASLARAN